MTVETLKRLLDYLPDDAQIVIGCEGYSNYNFEEDRYWDGEDSKLSIHNKQGKYIIEERNAEERRYR